MKHLLAVATLAITAVSFAQAPAGAPAGPAAELQRSYNTQKTNVTKAAEKMPADQYTFKFDDEVRTYARIVNHITEAQLNSCTAINGGKFDKSKVPSDTASKEEVVAGLKGAFDECDKAFASLTDTNLLEMVTAGQGKRSRNALAWGTISHDNEQYAQLSLYLRMKKITPPTAEK